MKNFSLSANFRKKLIGVDQIYPICPWCVNFIEIKQLYVTNSKEIYMKYNCVCNIYSNKGISFSKYYQKLLYFTYFKKGNCICKKKAGYKFCCECLKFVCKSCIKNHLKHVVTPVQINNPFSLCHNKMIEFYCLDCKKCLCLDCFKIAHLKHNCYKYQEYKKILQTKSSIFTNVSSFVKEKLKGYDNASMELDFMNLVKMFIKVFNDYSLHHINILYSIMNLQNIKIEKAKIDYKTAYRDYFNNPITISLMNPSFKGQEPIYIIGIVCLSNERLCVLFSNFKSRYTYCHIYSKNFYHVESKIPTKPDSIKLGLLKENRLYIASFYGYTVWNVEKHPTLIKEIEIPLCVNVKDPNYYYFLPFNNDSQIFFASSDSLYIKSIYSDDEDDDAKTIFWAYSQDDLIQQLEQFDDEHIILLTQKKIFFAGSTKIKKRLFKFNKKRDKNKNYCMVYASKKDNRIIASINEEDHSFIFVYTVQPSRIIYQYRYNDFIDLDSILLFKDEYYIGIASTGLCIFDKNTFKLLQIYKIPKNHQFILGHFFTLPNENLLVSLVEGKTMIFN